MISKTLILNSRRNANPCLFCLFKSNASNHTGGFMATTAVILLAMGTLIFSATVMASAAMYSDSVYRRELRIQARLDSRSCFDAASLMAAKDFFMNGATTIPEFKCAAVIDNSMLGNVKIKIIPN